MKKYLTKEVWLLTAFASAFSLIYGFLHENFLLEWINGLTLAGIAILVYGLLVFSWMKGNFAFVSWRPNSRVRKRAPGEQIPNAEEDPKRNMSFRQYRTYLQQKRVDTQNPAFTAGLIMTVISLILSVLYYVFS